AAGALHSTGMVFAACLQTNPGLKFFNRGEFNAQIPRRNYRRHIPGRPYCRNSSFDADLLTSPDPRAEARVRSAAVSLRRDRSLSGSRCLPLRPVVFTGARIASLRLRNETV